MESSSPSNYSMGLEVLKQEKYSDLRIVCHDIEFKVHRNIVCPRCPMLEAACGGGFKVRKHNPRLASQTRTNCYGQEAQTGVVKFAEVIPSIMGRVIFFLYTGVFITGAVPEIYQGVCADPEELTPNGLKIKDNDWVGQLDMNYGTAVSHARVSVMVYACADMMMIKELKSCAAKYFLTFTNHHFWHYYFHAALSTMLNIVAETDTELRIPVLELLLQKHIIPRTDSTSLPPKIHDKTIAILKESSGGWWDLATQELARFEQRSKAEVDAIEKKCEDKIRLSDNVVDRRVYREIHTFAKSLNETTNFRCKHNRRFTCTAEFVTGKWRLKLQPSCHKSCVEQIL